MITLSLLKFLENSGFGTIDAGLFWEKLGLEDEGLVISDVGDSRERGQRRRQTFELSSRSNTSDVAAYKQLKEVLDFLDASYGVCSLPAVEGITEGFENVQIMPTGAITNSGLDSQGRTLFTAIGQIYY